MRINKNQMFKILSAATLEEVERISSIISRKYLVKVIKPAHKTLVMARIRKSYEPSLFYLGEVLGCECIVEVNGARGIALIEGDDFDKTTFIAIIDAALNLGVRESQEIHERMNKLYEKQIKSELRNTHKFGFIDRL
ncbi:phosphonate C-P lyase system protein PhnG [Clostridium cylindrosporum]|uniref:Phosphonate C-P lyase system protein PhnG n=1 Tax=Clostridium cylindrosporum DSM 605 TaxID=1121307 RepID=A0A0J8D793_CLOCY|nr:phosphonate C-P lyase system protein PhnG [Clostridium cylindrosporum]KMT21767.1 hypothetical protein CLCY_3c00340 [Clostridium cylindrosporum DSM 605]